MSELEASSILQETLFRSSPPRSPRCSSGCSTPVSQNQKLLNGSLRGFSWSRSNRESKYLHIQYDINKKKDKTSEKIDPSHGSNCSSFLSITAKWFLQGNIDQPAQDGASIVQKQRLLYQRLFAKGLYILNPSHFCHAINQHLWF